jgi:AcrR family transcriptional regulator
VATELPVLGQEPSERADAARNRERVLCAAARLFERHGPDCVSMDAIAKEAGVGKGTLFRRFGDRAGLAGAVLSETETRLQDSILRGPPPLGPGAPPLERIHAFGRAYLQFLERNAQLILDAEAGNARLGAGPYVMYRTHLEVLLREAGAGADSEYLADALLAPLTARVFLYQRRAREFSLLELIDRWCDLVQRSLR